MGGIPPEIQAMMRMTEDMHMRSMGLPPGFRRVHKTKKVEKREDESSDDIMKRMNDISAEIGER